MLVNSKAERIAQLVAGWPFVVLVFTIKIIIESVVVAAELIF